MLFYVAYTHTKYDACVPKRVNVPSNGIENIQKKIAFKFVRNPENSSTSRNWSFFKITLIR